jgi:hypothetical protein
MRIFLVSGAVSALGAGVPSGERLLFDYVEITRRGGARLWIENLTVARQVAAILDVDTIGKFYFLAEGANNYLLGIERADGVQAFDPRDISIEDLRNLIEDP